MLTRAIQGLTVCALASAFATIAAAQQDFPVRPIRIVVPYPPGGSNDFLARLYGPKLTDHFGRQVVVDNRGGGNTIIGSELVARAAPDGYTLLLVGSTLVSMPHLYRHIPYDAIKDFSPIAGIARSEFLLVVHPSLPVRTVAELTAMAKKKPGELNYATSSTGGATHLAAVQYQMLAGVKLQQVPYKGGGPAMSDLMGGQVQLAFANPAGSVTFVRSGRLRAIAVTGEKRLETLPQVPTFTQGGLPGLALRNWYAITGPAGVAAPIVDRLATAIHKVSAMPEIQAAIVRQGLDTFTTTAQQLDIMRREDLASIGKIIKAGNIPLQD